MNILNIIRDRLEFSREFLEHTNYFDKVFPLALEQGIGCAKNDSFLIVFNRDQEAQIREQVEILNKSKYPSYKILVMDDTVDLLINLAKPLEKQLACTEKIVRFYDDIHYKIHHYRHSY